MSTITLYDDTQQYVNLFYSPAVTSYELLKCFFAYLHQEGVNEISRDLSEFFYEMKKNPMYGDVLHEIKFKNNGIFIYSDELEDGILTLQNMGLLGKKNPSFGVILNQYDPSIASEALNHLSEDYKRIIEEIGEQYKHYKGENE